MAFQRPLENIPPPCLLPGENKRWYKHNSQHHWFPWGKHMERSNLDFWSHVSPRRRLFPLPCNSPLTWGENASSFGWNLPLSLCLTCLVFRQSDPSPPSHHPWLLCYTVPWTNTVPLLRSSQPTTERTCPSCGLSPPRSPAHLRVHTPFSHSSPRCSLRSKAEKLWSDWNLMLCADIRIGKIQTSGLVGCEIIHLSFSIRSWEIISYRRYYF